MKILYLLTSSEGLGIARRLAEENNTVFVYIQNYNLEEDSNLQIIDSWREYLVDVDLVIGGSPGFCKYEEVIKKFGKPYLGMSKLGNLLNTKVKLDEFLQICELDKAEETLPTYVLTGFFNGRDWVSPLFGVVIDERLSTGDLGPVVGAMGTTLCVLTHPDYIDLMQQQLKLGFSRMGLRDMVTVFMCEEKVIGIGCGLTYDILECIIEGSKDRITDLLFELACGTVKTLDFTEDVVVCARLVVPPFPYISNIDLTCGIDGINPENLKHIFLDEAYINKDNCLCLISSGSILKVTARGRSIREAQRRVYRTLEGLNIQDKQYRLDIGVKAGKILHKNPIKEVVNE